MQLHCRCRRGRSRSGESGSHRQVPSTRKHFATAVVFWPGRTIGRFSPDIADAANPLRPLLRKGTPYLWNADNEVAFEKVKKAVTSPPVLSTYAPTAETVLQSDASRKNGLGFALLQQQSNQWRLIQCGSRFISDTESRYAIVELELKAAQWAVKKCRLYLIGMPIFTLVVATGIYFG